MMSDDSGWTPEFTEWARATVDRLYSKGTTLETIERACAEGRRRFPDVKHLSRIIYGVLSRRALASRLRALEAQDDADRAHTR